MNSDSYSALKKDFLNLNNAYADLMTEKGERQQEKVNQIASIIVDYLKLKGEYKSESDYSIIEFKKDEKVLTYQSKSNPHEKLKARWQNNRWIDMGSTITDDKLQYFRTEIAPKVKEKLEEKNRISQKSYQNKDKKPLQRKLLPYNQINRRNQYPSSNFPIKLLIRAGIEPTRNNYSHQEGVALIDWKANCKRQRIDELSNLAKKELLSAGYLLENNKNFVSKLEKLAGDKVTEDWEREAEELKEKYGMANSDGKERKISYKDLKQWYWESVAMKRSESNINSIENLIENSNKSSIQLSESDYRNYRTQRREFSSLDPIEQKIKLNQIGRSLSTYYFGIPTNDRAVSLSELKTWKQEAKALGKPKEYLKEIDYIIKKSPISTINNEKTISLKQRNYQLLKFDRSDFKKMQQEQNNSQKTGIGRFFSQ